MRAGALSPAIKAAGRWLRHLPRLTSQGWKEPMPSEATETPTTMPIALLRAADALGDLSAGIDALMYLSVSGHFDGTAQSALGFIHRNLSDLLEDARERVNHARSLQAAG
jgi:hypothetical protein